MQIFKKSISFFLINIGISIPSYAFSLPDWWQTQLWHPVAAVGGGISNSSNVSKSKNFPTYNAATDEFYNYSANHSTQTSSLFDTFLGAEWNLQPHWALQTGVGYNQVSPFSARGSFMQGMDIKSEDTYTYNYGLLARQVLVEGKFLYSVKDYYHPYIFAGLGAAFNKAYNYYTNAPAYFTRMYSNNTTTSFSYAVGAGLDYDIVSKIRLGIGYRFANLGKAQLGSAVIDTTSASGTLSQSNLYANELLIQVTWIN